MANDTFQCKKCGDILQSWQISMYREAIENGSSVSGGISCGSCGTVYSANDVAGVEKTLTGGSVEIPFWLQFLRNQGMLPVMLFTLSTLIAMLLLIWWGLSFLDAWIKTILSMGALVIANYMPGIGTRVIESMKKK